MQEAPKGIADTIKAFFAPNAESAEPEDVPSPQQAIQTAEQVSKLSRTYPFTRYMTSLGPNVTDHRYWPKSSSFLPWSSQLKFCLYPCRMARLKFGV